MTLYLVPLLFLQIYSGLWIPSFVKKNCSYKSCLYQHDFSYMSLVFFILNLLHPHLLTKSGPHTKILLNTDIPIWLIMSASSWFDMCKFHQSSYTSSFYCSWHLLSSMVHFFNILKSEFIQVGLFKCWITPTLWFMTISSSSFFLLAHASSLLSDFFFKSIISLSWKAINSWPLTIALSFSSISLWFTVFKLLRCLGYFLKVSYLSFNTSIAFGYSRPNPLISCPSYKKNLEW